MARFIRPGPLSNFNNTRLPGTSATSGHKGRMTFLIYLSSSTEFIPPRSFIPNVIGDSRTSTIPNFPFTLEEWRNQSTEIFLVSSLFASLFNWKWGGAASPAALEPQMTVKEYPLLLAATVPLVIVGSINTTGGRPPLFLVVLSREPSVSSTLMIMLVCHGKKKISPSTISLGTASRPKPRSIIVCFHVENHRSRFWWVVH